MTDLPAIDADGHLVERERDIRQYLEPPWDQRTTSLFATDQPWDFTRSGTLGQHEAHAAMSPAEEVGAWLRIMD